MKRINPIKLFKMMIYCVIAVAFLMICMEADNALIFRSTAVCAVLITIICIFINKLNVIIELLQIIADDKKDDTDS